VLALQHISLADLSALPVDHIFHFAIFDNELNHNTPSPSTPILQFAADYQSDWKDCLGSLDSRYPEYAASNGYFLQDIFPGMLFDYSNC